MKMCIPLADHGRLGFFRRLFGRQPSCHDDGGGGYQRAQLMVHIYTIGYMHDETGYQRFFSYIPLFTFSMLMLVMSNDLVATSRLGSRGLGVLPLDRFLLQTRECHFLPT